MLTKRLAILALGGLLIVSLFSWAQFPPGGRDSGGREFRGFSPGGQFPGGGFGGSSRGRGSFGGMDPNAMFDRMANGKEVVNSAELSGFQLMMFQRAAERMGITNGQITRQQYVAYMQQQRMAEGPSRGGPPGSSSSSGGPGSRSSSSNRDNRGGSSGPSPEALSMWAEGRFRRQDSNGDGLVNYDEMPESLRIERDKWDSNRDGFIDLNEYKTYFQAQTQQYLQERGAGFGGTGSGGGTPSFGTFEPLPEEEPRPVVYRAGKLPKELPGWFTEMDTDEDGQVGLYEWKNSRDVADFQDWDRNGDGFLTIEEVLRYEARLKGSSDTRTNSQSAGAGRDSYAAGPGGRSERGSGFGFAGGTEGGSGFGGRGGSSGRDFGNRGGFGSGPESGGRGGPGFGNRGGFGSGPESGGRGGPGFGNRGGFGSGPESGGRGGPGFGNRGGFGPGPESGGRGGPGFGNRGGPGFGNRGGFGPGQDSSKGGGFGFGSRGDSKSGRDGRSKGKGKGSGPR